MPVLPQDQRSSGRKTRSTRSASALCHRQQTHGSACLCVHLDAFRNFSSVAVPFAFEMKAGAARWLAGHCFVRAPAFCFFSSLYASRRRRTAWRDDAAEGPDVLARDDVAPDRHSLHRNREHVRRDRPRPAHLATPDTAFAHDRTWSGDHTISPLSRMSIFTMSLTR